MSYTPTTWQTGDTITAEKMNKMDNGWGAVATQLFSETVTTTSHEGTIGSELTYSQPIDMDAITVTFDGTNYECDKIEAFGQYFYGGFTESGPDFSTYPFAISSNANGENVIYTETASTVTVVVTAIVIEVSSDFSAAVALAAPSSPIFVATSNVTTWQEVHDAIAAHRVVAIFETNGDNAFCYFAGCARIVDGTYQVDTFMIDSGFVSTRVYTALSADGAIFSN